MNQVNWIRRAGGVIALVLVVVACALVYRSQFAPPAEPVEQSIECPDPAAGCRAGDVQIKFLAPATSAKPFIVEIDSEQKPQLAVEMADMAMGVAKFNPQPAGAGKWQARVGLPVCVSGSTRWLLLLNVNGKQYVMPFDAAYR